MAALPVWPDIRAPEGSEELPHHDIEAKGAEKVSKSAGFAIIEDIAVRGLRGGLGEDTSSTKKGSIVN